MKISLIVGSIRDNRLGERVAKLVEAEARKMPDWEVEVLDLKAINLPLYHDAVQPYAMNKSYPDQAVTKWSEAISSSDGFLFVTPEYNHGLPAPLKNAIDWLYPEWGDKVAAIIGYSSGIGGGIRACEQLRLTLAHCGVATVQTNLTIPYADKNISPDGQPVEDKIVGTLQKELSQLDKWARALKSSRTTSS